MCFRKIWDWLFHKPDPANDDPMGKVARRLLTFGKNLYGGGSDLNGCVNDSDNLSKKVQELYPDFDVRKFINNEVTIANYKEKVEEAISLLNPGAVVVVLPDSCFSGTVTRLKNNCDHPTKNRFHDPGLPPRKIVAKKLFRSTDLKWIVISGCQEHQTSADAFIGGKYVGAFTYYAIKALEKGMTYKEWFDKIRTYLPSSNFDQAPTLEGPDELINKIVFEDETLIIHNSSHGTYTYDPHGDEEDGYDEALYFDDMLIDDEIGAILDKIPI